MASTGGAGWLKLNSGDVVFARELDKGCACGCDDVTQAALVNEQLLRAIPNGNKLVDNFLDAKQRALGDRELRGPSLPVEDPDTGIFTGGTAFERTPNAHSVNGARTYTLGLGIEQATYAGYEYLPRNHREAMKMQAELVNAPVIGDETNMFFGNTQYNLASAQPKSSSDRDLQGQLGDSGIVHKDGNDAPGALTGMVSSPDMPDNYDKGTFHLVEIGAYASLEETQVMYFSGLRRHGGTPAHAPDGEVVKKWAYRCVIVCYPPSMVLENHGITALATLRSAGSEDSDAPPKKGKDGRVTYKKPHGMLTLDMGVKNNPENRQQQAWSQHTTFAADGAVIMQPEDQFNFFARSMYLLQVHSFAQLPFDVFIDPDDFFASMTFKSGDNVITAKPWKYAPVLNRSRFYQSHRIPLKKDRFVGGQKERLSQPSDLLFWLGKKKSAQNNAQIEDEDSEVEVEVPLSQPDSSPPRESRRCGEAHHSAQSRESRDVAARPTTAPKAVRVETSSEVR
ncbi:hypothetical protein FA95DRAFT_1597051 [Auriscalpium vulgare]|uniref:Uncharacterized protein n=1 Tax=Auriscalpium vulgare TaxID=40419 RepID=A0ACB8RLL6_9AGAM|nr:hypothetical protein FA95DRAFT_1597051 [Auriscalpium vulgare]